MIYANDQWAQLPVKDLYDNLILLASVNAARDMYEKGLQEIKDFNKEYGDFLSPISADMDWYAQNVTGKVRDVINTLYANGIDPLRSAEGRAAISRTINSMDIGRIARSKLSAINAQQYLESVKRLRENGDYNLDYENYLLNGDSLDNWDSSNGIWSHTGASKFKDIDSIVEPWVKNLEPSFDAEYTKKMNDGFDYNTVNPNRIMAVLNDELPEFTNSSLGGYYRYKALLQTGGDELKADALLKKWLFNKASDHTLVTRKINPIYEKNLDFAHQVKLKRIEHQYALQRQREAAALKYEMESSKPSVYKQTYNTLLANAASDSVTKYDPNRLDATEYSRIGKNINRTQSMFGASVKGNQKQRMDAFKNRYSTKIDAGTFIQWTGRDKVGGSIVATVGDINKIKSTSDVITNTQGFAGTPTNNSKTIQDMVRAALADGRKVFVTPLEEAYGAQTRNNNFLVDAKVRYRIYKPDKWMPGSNIEWMRKAMGEVGELHKDENGDYYVDVEGYWDLEIPSAKAKIGPDLNTGLTYDKNGNLLRGWLPADLYIVNDPANVFPAAKYPLKVGASDKRSSNYTYGGDQTYQY